MCDCGLIRLKQYLTNNVIKRTSKIRVVNCTEPIWNTTVDVLSVPKSILMCDMKCPQQIQQQCDKEHRCYGTDSKIDAVVCVSSDNTNKLLSAFITVHHQLHVYGFSLDTLKLPYPETVGLTHLNLTSCHISVVPETAFRNVPHLELLVLANKTIQNLAVATFHPLVSLRYLDLSSNQLLSFNDEMFSTAVVKTLYLHDNNIKQLSLTTLQTFEMVQNLSLSLYNNPWVCHCNDTFGHWIMEQKDILQSPRNITCDRTDVPVMFSNVTCATHTKAHVVHPGSKAAIIVSSVLAFLLAVALVVCILIYKYRLTTVCACIHLHATVHKA